MLTFWSKDILEAWISVYALLLPIVIKRDPATQASFIEKGVALTKKMTKISETQQVRASAALLMGELAAGDSL